MGIRTAVIVFYCIKVIIECSRQMEAFFFLYLFTDLQLGN